VTQQSEARAVVINQQKSSCAMPLRARQPTHTAALPLQHASACLHVSFSHTALLAQFENSGLIDAFLRVFAPSPFRQEVKFTQQPSSMLDYTV